MAKKIISFISTINKSNLTDDDKVKEQEYGFPDDFSNKIPGGQTNEAPLKYIMTQESFDGTEDAMLLLCTKKVREPLEYDWARDEAGNPLSTVGYVQKRVREFCAQNGRSFPAKISEIFWDAENATTAVNSAMVELMSQIRGGDRVFIDATGGLRDANFLILLLMQALRFKECVVELVVYSNYSAKQIQKIEYISPIMDMTNAMAEFTTYGRTRLFEKIKGDLDPQSRKFVETLSEYADMVETCRFQTDDRRTFKDILRSMSKQIQEMSREDSEVDPLMKQLLPAFREKMRFKDNKLDLASVVQWCAENHMLQQAATIFNENLFDELRACGIVDIKKGGTNGERFSSEKQISGLITHQNRNVQDIFSDYEEKVREYVENELLQRKDYLAAALENEAPGDGVVEKAILELLRCLFQDSVTLRTEEDAVLRARQANQPSLYPIVRSIYAKRPDGTFVDAKSCRPEDILDRLGEEEYSSALASILRESALTGLGNETKKVITTLENGAEEIPAEYRDYCDLLRHNDVLKHSPHISFVDLGILMIEYQFIRLVRNQMDHSNTITHQTVLLDGDKNRLTLSQKAYAAMEFIDSGVKPDKDDAKSMKLSDVIDALDPKGIKIHLIIAAGALRRLKEQVAAAKSHESVGNNGTNKPQNNAKKKKNKGSGMIVEKNAEDDLRISNAL